MPTNDGSAVIIRVIAGDAPGEDHRQTISNDTPCIYMDGKDSAISSASIVTIIHGVENILSFS